MLSKLPTLSQQIGSTKVGILDVWLEAAILNHNASGALRCLLGKAY